MRLAGLLLAGASLAGCATTAAPVVPLDTVYCGPADDRVFYPPSGFTPDEDADIRRAADEWSAHLARPFVFSLNGWQRILSWYPQPLPSGRYVGQWLADLHVMVILPGEAHVYEIALHEFGHVLGLEHVSSRTAVMCGEDKAPSPELAPGWCGDTRPTKLTDEDITEGRRVGAFR